MPFFFALLKLCLSLAQFYKARFITRDAEEMAEHKILADFYKRAFLLLARARFARERRVGLDRAGSLRDDDGHRRDAP